MNVILSVSDTFRYDNLSCYTKTRVKLYYLPEDPDEANDEMEENQGLPGKFIRILL